MARPSAARRANRTSMLATITEARRLAIEAMNPALRRRFAEMEARLGSVHEESLRYHHYIGQQIEEVKNNPEIYEDKGPALVTQALPLHKRTLRTSAQFAREYTVDELEDLVGMTNDDTGHRLHFGHMQYLLIVPDKAIRRELALRAVEGCWNPKRLHEEVKKAGYASESPHGRRHSVPSTVAAQLRQIRDISNIWISKQNTIWNGQGPEDHNVFAAVIDAPAGTVTEDDLEIVREIKELMESIRDAAGEDMVQCDRVVSHLEHQLAAQAAVARDERQERVVVQAHGRRRRAIDISSPTAAPEPDSPTGASGTPVTAEQPAQATTETPPPPAVSARTRARRAVAMART